MKRSLLGILWAIVLVLLTGCLGDDQHQQQEELEVDEDSEMADMDDAGAGEAMENVEGAEGEDYNGAGANDAANAENEYQETNNGNVGGNVGEENPTGEEILEGQDATSNEFQNEAGGGEGINNAVETGEFDETANPVDSPAVDTDVGTADDAAAAPEAPQAAYTPGGVVRYVMSGGATLYTSPDGSAPSGSLEQGDHPLIFAEGEWARTSDGHYLPMTSLTNLPVGRNEAPAIWQ